MSKNIEEMFRKYKLDENVVKGLSQSIRDFETSAKSGADSAGELAKNNRSLQIMQTSLQNKWQHFLQI